MREYLNWSTWFGNWNILNKKGTGPGFSLASKFYKGIRRGKIVSSFLRAAIADRLLSNRIFVNAAGISASALGAVKHKINSLASEAYEAGRLSVDEDRYYVEDTIIAVCNYMVCRDVRVNRGMPSQDPTPSFYKRRPRNIVWRNRASTGSV